jgi:hypothetical protein
MKAFLKRHWLIVLLCTGFALVAALFIATWYRYQLNPDATSYITIARKYADGNFRQAINGYWGPLLSWLLVPAIWLHIEPIIAAKLIAAAAGTGVLIVTYCFLRDRKVSMPIIAICCTGLAGLMLEWCTVEAITPDMLLCLLIALFAVRLADFVQKPSRWHGMLLGGIGALMYYAKGFGFFLFIVAVALVAAWQWWQTDKNLTRIIRRYMPMAITFIVLVLPFIALISLKYHKPTINNAGSYDHHAHGYYGAKTADILPIISTAGPLQPTNDTAINAWEDPTALTDKVPGWSPLHSKAELNYFIFGTIGKNINNVIRYMYAEGPFVVLGMVILAVAYLQRRNQRYYALFGLVTALMLGGYSLVLAEGRYMWPTIIMGTMAGGLWVSTLETRKLLNHAQLAVGGMVLVGLVALNTGQILAQTPYIDRSSFHIAQQLHTIIPDGSSIMSDNFDGSYHLCYYQHLHCYNVLDPPATNADAYYQLLRRNHITYLVDYSTKINQPQYVSFVQRYYTQVDDRTVDGKHLTTYKLNGL